MVYSPCEDPSDAHIRSMQALKITHGMHGRQFVLHAKDLTEYFMKLQIILLENHYEREARARCACVCERRNSYSDKFAADYSAKKWSRTLGDDPPSSLSSHYSKQGKNEHACLKQHIKWTASQEACDHEALQEFFMKKRLQKAH